MAVNRSFATRTISSFLVFALLATTIHAFTLSTITTSNGTPKIAPMNIIPDLQRSQLKNQLNSHKKEEEVVRNDRKIKELWSFDQSKYLLMATLAIGSVFCSVVTSVTAMTFDQMQYKSNEPAIEQSKYTHLLIAKGAYVPESGYDTLDFSLPAYRVDEPEPTMTMNDLLGGSSGTVTTDPNKKKVSSSSSAPNNRAEKGALAVAQAKAKREAAKADALVKQQALKQKALGNIVSDN